MTRGPRGPRRSRTKRNLIRSAARLAASLLLGAALGTALSPSSARAADSPGPLADPLTLSPPAPASADAGHAGGARAGASAKPDPALPAGPQYLQAAPESPGLIVHGFLELQLKSAYITPRGLVVETTGTSFQPVGGLVFPLYSGEGTLNSVTFTGGVWNAINSHQDDRSVGPWNEVDPFAVLDFKFLKDWDFSVTYVPFISPPHNFKTEHNIEFKLAYDDSKLLGDRLGGIALHPYMKFFWNVKGDSTVVLGKRGGTFDVELGIDPSYTYKGIANYPITLDFPLFFTVGPKNFWGGDQNFGTASAGAVATVPLSFIPKRWGNWHADVGVNYYYLINDNLVNAARVLGNNHSRNELVGFVGIGVGF